MFPPAASAALDNDKAIAISHILDHKAGFRIADHSSGRYGDLQILTVFSHKLPCGAVGTVFRHELAAVLKVQKGVLALVGDENDVAALTAVSAVGTAVRDVFFPAEGHGTVAALTRLDVNIDLIDKHTEPSLGIKNEN